MTKDIQKWADVAMFSAEESNASEGPKAFLLQGTPDPLGSVVAFSAMYTGKVVRNKRDVTDEERRYHLEQMKATKLKAPLEAVNLHFMIEGVTRSFTHQMVRQRTAAYAQESLRFAVIEDVASAVALPPSLAEQADDSNHRVMWDMAIEAIEDSYLALVNSGVPAEDARGLLPHAITTRLNYTTNLRNLQDHAGNRLCTQAQFEWRMVWVRMLEAMRAYCTGGNCAEEFSEHGMSYDCDNWQWIEIANLFRPVCYLTGKCEFKAKFDRACKIRDRVDANEEIARPSTEWDQDHNELPPEADAIKSPGQVWTENNRPVFIGAISPAEWLLDHRAARVSE